MLFLNPPARVCAKRTKISPTKRTQVPKAKIVLTPPKTFTRTGDFLGSLVNIGDLTFYDAQIVNLQNNQVLRDDPYYFDLQLSGNPIFFEGTSSTLETTAGYIAGLGELDNVQKIFFVKPNTYADVKGANDIEVIVESGIFSGSMQTGDAYRSVCVCRDPYAHVGLTLSGPEAQVMLDLSYSDNSIDLNGGSVVLTRDLKFGDDTRFVHTGTVNLNGKTLSFGGLPLTWDTQVLWRHASDIQLNSRTELNTTWYFDGDGHVSANGNIIDLTGGGTLWVRQNTALWLTNMKIKGLGSGHIVFEDQTSQLLLSNVEIELDNDYTFTTGGIYVEGPTTIITKDKIVSFEQKASLTVDGLTLWYDTLSYGDNNNIQPLMHDTFANPSGKYVTGLNHGVVCQKNWAEMVRTHSNALHYYAPVIRNNSYLLRQTSNATVTCAEQVVADDVLMRTTSNATHAYAFLTRTTSRLVAQTSNAIDYYAPMIRNNSYLLHATSNAMNYYAPIIRNNSYLIHASSNVVKSCIMTDPLVVVYEYEVEPQKSLSDYFADVPSAYSLYSDPRNGMIKTSVVVAREPLVFADQEHAFGFLCLEKGCTIPAGATVYMNIVPPLKGPLDLQKTGRLVLENDLFLACNATLTQGGLIYGQGNTIYLQGDLKIPAGQALIFVSNTIIDAQGHTIIFERAQHGCDPARLIIDGPAQTKLIIKDAKIDGMHYDNATIAFGGASGQQLVFVDNDDVVAFDAYGVCS